MTVDNELAVGRLLILADARFNQRSIFQGREAEGQILTNKLQRLLADDSFSRGRIEGRTTRVIGNFETTARVPRDAIKKTAAMLAPHWQVKVTKASVARWRTKEEDVLLGGLNEIADGAGKKLAEPGSASEHVMVRGETRPVSENDPAQNRILKTLGQNCELPVLAAPVNQPLRYSLATGASLQISAFRLVEGPADTLEVDLRPALLHHRRGEFLEFDLGRA